jgi:hypothetical protein
MMYFNKMLKIFILNEEEAYGCEHHFCIKKISVKTMGYPTQYRKTESKA